MRFTDLDLARLPPPDLPAPDFDAIYAQRIAELTARFQGAGIPYDVGTLATDPMALTQRAGSYRETLVYARQNDALRAVLLATSQGIHLDHLGAGQVPPLARKTLVPADPVAGTAAVMEGDDAFRRRIQLAPEALSTAGPEGGYLFFALEHDGVKTASVYGPQSFGGTRAQPFTPLGEVHVPIVAAAGDGTAPAALVAAVQAEMRSDDRRPIADFVTVSAAEILPYTIHAVLRIGAGADPAIVKAAALSRLAAQADRQHQPGRAALAQMFYGAAYVADATGAIVVEEVILTTDGLTPFTDVNADPITAVTPQAAYRAPYCTAFTVETEIVDD